MKATKWLFKQYDKNKIEEIIKNSPQGEWNKKSLNFWSFFFKIKPDKIRQNHE